MRAATVLRKPFLVGTAASTDYYTPPDGSMLETGQLAKHRNRHAGTIRCVWRKAYRDLRRDWKTKLRPIVLFIIAILVFASRPWPAAASMLLQSTAYPQPATASPTVFQTRTEFATAETTGTAVFPEPSLIVTTGPNIFLTEDAAIGAALATPAQSQTLPATRTATVTRSLTITRTPTPTLSPSHTFTPSATGPTATITVTLMHPGGDSVVGGRPLDWRVFVIGLSLPLLIVLVGAVVVRLGNPGRK